MRELRPVISATFSGLGRDGCIHQTSGADEELSSEAVCAHACVYHTVYGAPEWGGALEIMA